MSMHTKMTMGQAARVAGAGLLIGTAGAIASSRLLRSFLFDVDPLDPAIYLAVGGVLALAALLAAWLPARRASRVDPIVILRTD